MASENGSNPAAASERSAEPATGKPKRRRGRRLALLLAIAGGILYALRRRQQRQDLDEAVWHEAPTASPTSR